MEYVLSDNIDNKGDNYRQLFFFTQQLKQLYLTTIARKTTHCALKDYFLKKA